MLVQNQETEAGDERASYGEENGVEAGAVTPLWAPLSPHKHPP